MFIFVLHNGGNAYKTAVYYESTYSTPHAPATPAYRHQPTRRRVRDTVRLRPKRQPPAREQKTAHFRLLGHIGGAPTRGLSRLFPVLQRWPLIPMPTASIRSVGIGYFYLGFPYLISICWFNPTAFGCIFSPILIFAHEKHNNCRPA